MPTLPPNRLLYAWLPAVLWLGLIALESTDLFSSSQTSRFLLPLLTWMFGHLNMEHFWLWHHMLRKIGHVVGYGILSLLLFRAWRGTLPATAAEILARWSFRWAAMAWLGSAVIASLDEWHQTFLPSRTGAVSDVILDSTAALAVQVLIFGWLHFRRRSREPAVAQQ